ncbi:hypothetical protein HYH03_003259 [Edaphochlamys debaryana]|uniref:Uncharacterized protein n=1 Tax=Edaphochlamys debaryana TaxID=47281 RepID=A0A836C3G5_9CHLO|nr:hypothetical protein HYH03_003259 [Edaphochlamys debaryana]|eukprot:KAG2499076.1 hypothetical protein HYH03_003259 [Edaphochlamys debaryana]
MEAFSARAAAADAVSDQAPGSSPRERKMADTARLDQAAAAAAAAASASTPTRGGPGQVTPVSTPAGPSTITASAAAAAAAASAKTTLGHLSVLYKSRNLAKTQAAVAAKMAENAETCQWVLQPDCPSAVIACAAKALQTYNTSAQLASDQAAAAAAAAAAAMSALPPADTAMLGATVEEINQAAAAAEASAAAVRGIVFAVREELSVRLPAEVAAAGLQSPQGCDGEVEAGTEGATGGEGGQEPPSAEEDPSAEAAGEAAEQLLRLCLDSAPAVASETDVSELEEAEGAWEWGWQVKAETETKTEAESVGNGEAGWDDGGGYDLLEEGQAPTTARFEMNDPRGFNPYDDSEEQDGAQYEQQDGAQSEEQDGALYEQQDGAQSEEQDEAQSEEQDGAQSEEQDGAQSEEQDGAQYEEQDGAQDEEQDGAQSEEQYGGQDDDLAQVAERCLVDLDVNDKWDDIVGLEEVKGVLDKAIVLTTIMPEASTSPRKPAKTMLARAAASESSCTLITVSPTTLASCQGDIERVVRLLPKLARTMAPAIIFIDEADSLCSQGDTANADEPSWPIQAELLKQVAGVLGGDQDEDEDAGGGEAGPSVPKHVLVATNRPWDVDLALWRCMDKRVYIPLPGHAQRVQLLSMCLKEVELAPDLDLERVAARIEGYSGDDVTKEPMTSDDFAQATRKVKPSVSEEHIRHHEEWMAEFGSA